MAPPYEHQAKKRRMDGDDGPIDTFKPATRFRPTVPREWTVSVAIPTSIITDCVTREQRTTYAGRVARALAVFAVDEIIVYDDSPMHQRPHNVDEDAFTGDTDPAHFLEHLLTYLETPPFMRKTLFPLHPNLRSQGLLPSLDMPHHPHKDEWLPYREGMTLEGQAKGGKGTLVDIGMPNTVTISESIPPRTRVTLKMPDDGTSAPEPVHPAAPRTEAGYFWGFSVRKAITLSNVFTQSPYEEGYDISIGTSERGIPLSKAFPDHKETNFTHLLIVFGGPRGLEYAAMNDPELAELGIAGARTRELFDNWVNILPNQGSRTIRTDEAMMIGLTGLRRLWDAS
ncbi:putative RNA methyltransferase [Lasiosphaeris hirsuta]|uniref:RNA methyltransferase n=1 Tax=Lasiosphaeris hirsuta TaxID=260670 RepID=A0AA40B9D9_9PEZI|nr:putative RNA methyltransferase [Lasiosphaeris hirsuta]